MSKQSTFDSFDTKLFITEQSSCQPIGTPAPLLKAVRQLKYVRHCARNLLETLIYF